MRNGHAPLRRPLRLRVAVEVQPHLWQKLRGLSSRHRLSRRAAAGALSRHRLLQSKRSPIKVFLRSHLSPDPGLSTKQRKRERLQKPQPRQSLLLSTAPTPTQEPKLR